jgi:HsdM N-terminal domain
VLRRLDCVLAPTKAKVLETQGKLRGKLENLDPQLRRASRFAFYNTSRYDFDKLLADAPHLKANLRNYIAGFSPNMREVLEKVDFDNTITKLDEAGLLFQVMVLDFANEADEIRHAFEPYYERRPCRRGPIRTCCTRSRGGASGSASAPTPTSTPSRASTSIAKRPRTSSTLSWARCDSVSKHCRRRNGRTSAANSRTT